MGRAALIPVQYQACYLGPLMTNPSLTTDDARQPVAVYRDLIGVPSEIEFSRRQYLGFQSLRPVWIGRTVLPDAVRLGAPVLRIGGLDGLLFRHFGRRPGLDLTGFSPVVHAQFARGGALALPIARAMNARMVVTLHGGDVGKDRNWRGTVLARRWPAVIAHTHRFVCVSRTVADIAARRGTPESLLTVLPIGVEFADTSTNTVRPAGFLFAGRFVEKKGITVLAEAIRRLRAMGDNTPLVCAGDGPMRPVLERLARDCAYVTLTGWLSAETLIAQMSQAIALIVPSVVAANGDAEGLPSVVPEAMAHGCLVIGTDQGGIAEAVRHNTTGLLAPPGDAAALAAVMHRASTEPGLAPRLSQTAFTWARARLNALYQSELLERILLDAAAPR